MLVLLKRGVSEAEIADATSRLRMFGLSVHRAEHAGQVRLGAVGEGGGVDWDRIRAWPAVESITPIPVPFKLVSRVFQPQETVISVGRCAIGNRQLAIMAGPGLVAMEEQGVTPANP